MASKRIILDLETYRTRNEAVIKMIRHEQIARTPAQNKSKEEKLMWNTPEAVNARVDEALAKTSVDVLYAEVLCVAIGIDDDIPGTISCMENESDGLRWFREWFDFHAGPETILVGHNISSFDLRILTNRFRALNILPPELFPSIKGRYWSGRVWDTMLQTPCSNGLGMVSLADACMVYGIPSPKGAVCLEDGTPLEGSTVGLAFERGEYEAILKYAEEDIAATRALYKAQTFDYKRDTWEAEDRSMAEVYAIRDADHLTTSEKHSLILQALAAMGRVSRDLLPPAVAA
jgi:predicted PolB exonuclease-like 3'-5' exonuclease